MRATLAVNGLNFNFDFLKQIFSKIIFPSKTKNVNTTIEFYISQGTKFQIKLTILIFWTKFVQKGYFRSKTENVNTNIEFFIFELVQIPNFSIFGPNLPKKGIFGLKRKSRNTFEFCIFEVVQLPNFSLNRQFGFFERILSKKGIFGLKQKK